MAVLEGKLDPAFRRGIGAPWMGWVESLLHVPCLLHMSGEHQLSTAVGGFLVFKDWNEVMADCFGCLGPDISMTQHQRAASWASF